MLSSINIEKIKKSLANAVNKYISAPSDTSSDISQSNQDSLTNIKSTISSIRGESTNSSAPAGAFRATRPTNSRYLTGARREAALQRESRASRTIGNQQQRQDELKAKKAINPIIQEVNANILSFEKKFAESGSTEDKLSLLNALVKEFRKVRDLFMEKTKQAGDIIRKKQVVSSELANRLAKPTYDIVKALQNVLKQLQGRYVPLATQLQNDGHGGEVSNVFYNVYNNKEQSKESSGIFQVN